MGLLSDKPLRRVAEDVVWCYDSNVKVPDHLVGAGWIDAKDCTVEAGADVVRIRALDDDGKARVDGLREEKSEAEGRLLARRLGVVSVNGKRGDILATWLRRLSLEQRDAAYWLGMRILCDTVGTKLSDYHKTARICFGIEAMPVAEDAAEKGDVAGKDGQEVTDAGASKSQAD